MKRALLLLCVLACSAPTAPELHEVPRSDRHARVWARVEACSGLQRAITTVRWFEVPDALTYGADGRFGEYLPHYGIVYAEWVSDEGIGHEVLHALRRDVGETHAGPEWARCAGVVI